MVRILFQNELFGSQSFPVALFAMGFHAGCLHPPGFHQSWFSGGF
jgi:hypothetical protein